MCRLLNVSRATFYRRPTKKEHKDDSTITGLVIKIFKESYENYGGRRIRRQIIKETGLCVSRRKIRQIMRENDLFSTYQVKNFKTYKTIRGSNNDPIGNELDRDFQDRKPLEYLVSDLTYVRVGKVWNYVCFISDVYNREIVGYAVGENKDADLVLKALQTIDYNLDDVGCFHSDRGLEFKNKSIENVLTMFDIQRSLSYPGCPYDNAVAESLNHTSKVEFLERFKYRTTEELELKVFEFVYWYNNKRLHSFLDYMAPIEYRIQNTH